MSRRRSSYFGYGDEQDGPAGASGSTRNLPRVVHEREPARRYDDANIVYVDAPRRAPDPDFLAAQHNRGVNGGLVKSRNGDYDVVSPSRHRVDSGLKNGVSAPRPNPPSRRYSEYSDDDDIDIRIHRRRAASPPEPRDRKSFGPSDLTMRHTSKTTRTEVDGTIVKETEEKTVDSLVSDNVQGICRPAEPANLTVHLELPISEDVDDELEELARLRRLGNFKAARAFFDQYLQAHLPNPYVFVQYAELLLDMGLFGEVLKLDAKSSFRDYDGSLGPQPTAEEDTGQKDTVGPRWRRRRRHNLEDVPHSPVRYDYDRRHVPNTRVPKRQREPVETARVHWQDGNKSDYYYDTDDEIDARVRRYRTPSRDIQAETITRSDRRPEVRPREREREVVVIDNTRVEDYSREQQRWDRKLAQIEPERSPRRSPPRPEHVVVEREVMIHNADKQRDELDLLAWNWRLLRALASIRVDASCYEARSEYKMAWEIFDTLPQDSTELQIVLLALRVGTIANKMTESSSIRMDLPVMEAPWPDLYRDLLTQNRSWDLRDFLVAGLGNFGLHQLGMVITDADDDNEFVTFKAIVSREAQNGRDGVTNLAYFDQLVSGMLELDLDPDILDETKWQRESARDMAAVIIKESPDAMKSRAFARWLLVEAAAAGCDEDSATPDAFEELCGLLEESPGKLLPPSGWITLPIYIPKGTEVPPWNVPDVPAEAIVPVELALKMAKDMDDYPTQVLCYKLLALHTRNPAPLLLELARIQKTVQEDYGGYLETCLTRYIGCTSPVAQKQLLADLTELDDAKQHSEKTAFYCRDTQLVWAKDFIERSLRRKLNIGSPRLAGLYWPYLDSDSKKFIQSSSWPSDFPTLDTDRIRRSNTDVRVSPAREMPGEYYAGKGFYDTVGSSRPRGIDRRAVVPSSQVTVTRTRRRGDEEIAAEAVNRARYGDADLLGPVIIREREAATVDRDRWETTGEAVGSNQPTTRVVERRYQVPEDDIDTAPPLTTHYVERNGQPITRVVERRYEAPEDKRPMPPPRRTDLVEYGAVPLYPTAVPDKEKAVPVSGAAAWSGNNTPKQPNVVSERQVVPWRGGYHHEWVEQNQGYGNGLHRGSDAFSDSRESVSTSDDDEDTGAAIAQRRRDVDSETQRERMRQELDRNRTANTPSVYVNGTRVVSVGSSRRDGKRGETERRQALQPATEYVDSTGIWDNWNEIKSIKKSLNVGKQRVHGGNVEDEIQLQNDRISHRPNQRPASYMGAVDAAAPAEERHETGDWGFEHTHSPAQRGSPRRQAQQQQGPVNYEDEGIRVVGEAPSRSPHTSEDEAEAARRREDIHRWQHEALLSRAYTEAAEGHEPRHKSKRRKRKDRSERQRGLRERAQSANAEAVEANRDHSAPFRQPTVDDIPDVGEQEPVAVEEVVVEVD